MATTIVTKKGSGAPAASDLVEGELAVDTTNGRLYTENSSAAVVELGSNPSGNITFADNGKAIFGAGSDLQIYHDGSHSVIADFGTGDLRLNGVSVEMRSAATGASYLRANNAGSVDVYHNGSAKLATTNTGIDVTGTATMDGLTVSDGTETTSIPATADRLSFTGASLNYIQSAGSLFVQPTGDLVLNGSGAEIMRLKSGNAGIGTSSPNVSLEVDGGTANGSIARFHNNGDRYLELSAESDGTYDDAISVFKKNSSVGQFAFRNPTTEYMRIDSSGRVGIGTASPSYPLTIHNTGDGIKFEVSDTVDANYRIQVSGSNIVTGPSTSSAYIFQTGNTERARIDSSGNVGIGTTSPSYKMSLRDDSTSSYPLSLENNNIGTAGVHTGIRFGYVGNTYQKGAIIFESQDGSGRGKMYFALEGTANSSNADETDAKMTIDYDGNVGIGTSSPTADLEVSSASNPEISIASTVGSTSNFLNFKAISHTQQIQTQLKTIDNGDFTSDLAFLFKGTGTDGALSEKMRIDSSGRVGIGTDSPSNKLHIQGSVISGASSDVNATLYLEQNANNSIQINSGAANNGQIRFGDASSSYRGALTYNHSDDSLQFVSAGSERMRIDSSGNVGIGTSSPTAKLTVSGTGVGAAIDWTNTTASTGRSYRWVSLNNGTGFALEDMTSVAERMRIDSSGNLLVGTTSLTTTTAGIKLDADGDIAANRDGDAAAFFGRLSSDGEIVRFRKDGSTVGSIGTKVSSTYIGTGDTGLLFWNAQNAVTPYDTGDTVTNGTIDLGVPNYKFKDLYLAGGAYLGGTAAANKLDDYEEGTWNPTVAGDATGVIESPTTGYYTKVGNQVTLYFNFRVTTNFTSSYIGGLPFQVDHASMSSSWIYSGGCLTGANNTIAAGVQNTTYTIRLYDNQNINDTHILNTTNEYYRFQFSYRTGS
jgi:hypothetical protein